MGYIARKGKAVGDSEASVVKLHELPLWVHCLRLHWKLVRARVRVYIQRKEQFWLLIQTCLIILLLYLTLLGCIAFIFSMYRHVYYLYTTALISCIYAFRTFYLYPVCI